MTKELSSKSRISQGLIENGFSFYSLKELSLRSEGSFPANTLEYYVILLIYEEVTLEIEKVKYNIKPNQIVFVGPKKNIHSSNIMSEANYIISFSSQFYEKSSNDVFTLNSNLFFDNIKDAIVLENNLSIKSFRENIFDHLYLVKNKNNGLYTATVHNLIERLILNGLFQLEDQPKIEGKDFSSLKIANQFKVFLHKNFTKEKSVQYYADHFNVTTRKLTEICEEIFGKTAKQIILDKIVNETIRMIKNTDLTISEISHELGYNDDANFSKLVKNHSGKTPKQLRLESVDQ